MPWAMFTNKWLASALAVAGLALALWVQTARLNAAHKAEAAAAQVATQWRTNFEAMEATNAANVRAIEKLQAEAARIEAAATTARRANASLTRDLETIRKALTHDAQSDGPVGPILCRAVNELRRLAGEASPACGG